MKERWKPISGFENFYEISNIGAVKSLYYNRLLKPMIDRYGYLYVNLSKNGSYKSKKIHRLVISSFSGESIKQVNHKDGNKLNNQLNNLEYCTCRENVQHAIQNGLINNKGKHHHFAKIKEEDVIEIRDKYKNGVSVAKLTKMYPISNSSIQDIVKNRHWKHLL